MCGFIRWLHTRAHSFHYTANFQIAFVITRMTAIAGLAAPQFKYLPKQLRWESLRIYGSECIDCIHQSPVEITFSLSLSHQDAPPLKNRPRYSSRPAPTGVLSLSLLPAGQSPPPLPPPPKESCWASPHRSQPRIRRESCGIIYIYIYIYTYKSKYIVIYWLLIQCSFSFSISLPFSVWFIIHSSHFSILYFLSFICHLLLNIFPFLCALPSFLPPSRFSFLPSFLPSFLLWGATLRRAVATKWKSTE